jgi:P pilus assembly chaperone PapD
MLLLVGLLTPRPASALGDLTITPWRIAFQARDHSAGIELINGSDSPHTYRVGWTLLKALPDGRYEQVFYNKDKDKDPHSVANMVIVSPRQVMIEPHGEQIIRLSLRRPADLPPGEYRAHMTFIKMADHVPIKQDPKAKGVSMSLNVNVGFSIPIIVRQGDDKDLKVSLQSPKLRAVDNGSMLDVEVHRDAGKFSTYGSINAYWKPPKGDEVKVGDLSNVALYPEVQTRKISVPLLRKANLTAGTVRVVYEGKDEYDGTKFDEKTFPIGK